jgi:hypothetical protein
LWVVAQRRKTEGCNQIVRETECRILQGERERERESGGFEHFSQFLVYGYSFFWVEDAHEWWYTIYYVTQTHGMWNSYDVKFIWSRQNKR